MAHLEAPPYTELGVPTPVQTIDAPKLETVLGWLIDQVVRGAAAAVSDHLLPGVPFSPPPHLSLFLFSL